jgi:hypothetical protein
LSTSSKFLPLLLFLLLLLLQHLLLLQKPQLLRTLALCPQQPLAASVAAPAAAATPAPAAAAAAPAVVSLSLQVWHLCLISQLLPSELCCLVPLDMPHLLLQLLLLVPSMLLLLLLLMWHLQAHNHCAQHPPGLPSPCLCQRPCQSPCLPLQPLQPAVSQTCHQHLPPLAASPGHHQHPVLLQEVLWY